MRLIGPMGRIARAGLGGHVAAEKLPHKWSGWVLADLGWGSDLFDPCVVHDYDTVRDFERLVLIVRHK